jgi:hypothetical protein
MPMSAAKVGKLVRRFDKSFKPYLKKLTERYGTDPAVRIGEQTRIEYSRLLPLTPQFEGRFNIFNWVIGLAPMIVALHKSMKADGKTAEETARILFEAADDSHRSIPGGMRWIARKFFFSGLFLRFSRRSALKVRSHPEGWTIDYRRGDGGTCDWYFECSQCGVVNYFRKHGVEDLAPYCNYIDFIQSRVLGLGMQNPENIGQGSGVCREYFKQGRETCLPENLKSIAEPDPAELERRRG